MLPAPTSSARMSHGIDLEALIRRHQLGVWRYLRSLGAAPDVAEDVLQDTFLVACRKLVDDRGDAAAASFLRQTARQLLWRRRRDQGRRERRLLELADRQWQQDCGDDDGERWLLALRHCLQRLDGRPQLAVRMFYGEGRSRSDVAAALGMKETGLKTLLQRLRASLRQCIEQRLGGERQQRGGER